MILLEGLLRAGGEKLVPRSDKWGHAKIQELVDRYAEYAATRRPLDAVIFGTSQGYTWIDQKDLNDSGISTINASIPGGNLAVSRLLAQHVLLDQITPKVVVITIGPMSLAHWNEHLVKVILQSPVGGAYLENRRVSLWLQHNVELVKLGGHRLNAGLLADMQRLWKPTAPRQQRSKRTDDLESSERSTVLRPLDPSPEQFEAFAELLSEAEFRGAKTAVINMPLCDGGKHNPAWPYAEYRRAMLRVAGDRPVLDLDAVVPPSDFSDCAHPTREGIAAVRDVVRTFLRSCLLGQQRP
jgi:hypothetical protein